MEIKRATTQRELNELDQLLWDILWKPLDFERNIREAFRLDTPQIDIVAVDKGTIVGTLVSNWLSDNEIEIRHIAVATGFQNRGIGRLLVEELFKLIRDEVPITIQTHARNTSVVFFSKLGFRPAGDRLVVDPFIRHGIWLQQMSMEL